MYRRIAFGALAIGALALGACGREEGASPTDPSSELASSTTVAGDSAGRHMRGRFGPARMILAHADELGLTAEQKSTLERIDAEMKARADSMHAAVRAIVGDPPARGENGRRERPQLTDEQKAQLKALFESRRETGRAEMQAFRDRTEAVLTADQLEMLKTMREQARERFEAAHPEGRRGPGGRGHHGRPGMPGDSAGGARGFGPGGWEPGQGST